MRLTSAAVALLASIACGQTGRVIQTYAGADWTFQGDGRPAVAAPIGRSWVLALDALNNLYYADRDNFQVYRVTADGTLNIIAGSGIEGNSGLNGPARNASLSLVNGLAIAPDGSVYIAGSGQIRKITADGILRPVINANASNMLFDAEGNLVFSEFNSHRIRKLTPSGELTTIAGTQGQPAPSTATGIGDGGPATAALLNGPRGLRFDTAGNLYIAEFLGNRVRRIGTDGVITTVAGGGTGNVLGPLPATQAFIVNPSGVAFDSAGNLYIVSLAAVLKVTPDGVLTTIAGRSSIRDFSGDGGPASAARLNFLVSDIIVDASDNIYVADEANRRVRRIGTDGNIGTFAGNNLYRFTADGTPAQLAFFRQPGRVAVSPDGRLYVADAGDSRVKRIEADGTITTVAGNGQNGFPSAERVAATSTPLFNIQGITVDRQGNLYIVQGTTRVSRVTPEGIIETFAGNGTAAGEGVPAITAQLQQPVDIANDDTGNVYIAEHLFAQPRIRKISPARIITTVVGGVGRGFSGDGGPATQAQISNAQGLTTDAAGNLYFADVQNGRVRKVSPEGIITTVAGGGTGGDGGPAVGALLVNPAGLALDRGGNIYVSTSSNDRVRVITPDGRIATFAGSVTGFSGDGGPPQQARLSYGSSLFGSGVGGLAVDTAGNLFIADTANYRIRVISGPPASFTRTPDTLSFTARAGDAATLPQQISLASAVVGLPFNVTTTAAFLSVTSSSTVMPATVDVSANPGTLAPGTYQATITIASGVAGVPPRTVAVTFVVQQGVPAQLAVDTAAVPFAVVRGGPPASKRITVLNRGGGRADFTARAATTSGGNWLSVSPAQGGATPAAPVSLNIAVNAAGLAPGTYAGSVTVASGAVSVVTPVTLTVSGSGQSILLSQTGLTFTGVVNGGATPSQKVAVLNTGAGSYPFSTRVLTAAGIPRWLSVTPSAGFSDADQPAPSLSVAVNAAGLDAGDYYGRIQVISPTADNSPQEITVVFTVLPEGSNPGPVVQPAGLVFTAVAGEGDPGSQVVAVSNLTGSGLSFGGGVATLDGGRYLQFQPSSANVAPGSIQLAVQPVIAGLAAGVYRGAITLVFSEGSVRNVTVLLVVAPAGTKPAGVRRATGCTPARLLPLLTSLGTGFSVPASFPASITARVVDDCGDPHTSGSVIASFSNGDPPLSLNSLRDGQWSATWLSRNTSQRQVTITVSSEQPASGLKGSIQVSGGLNGDANPPVIRPGSIVSAPGAMIRIFGARLAEGEATSIAAPVETELAGASVVAGGRALPLFKASDGQIDAQMPFDTPVNVRLQLIVTRGSRISLPEEIAVAATQPAIFTVDDSGSGQGRIFVVAADGSTKLADAAAPAKAGDALVIYCSGLGTLDVPVTDGAPGPSTPAANAVAPVTATIGGVSAPVSFAGLAPGVVGLYLVNAAVPSGVSAGDTVPVVLTSGGQVSPAVTIAVR